MKTIYISIIAASLLMACNNHSGSHGHSHDVIGGHADHDDHGKDSKTLSYTLFEGDYELFVEFPALIVGQTSSFAAHLTQLSTYSPVLEGQLTVSLIKGNKGIRHRVEEPSSPGIFRPALQAKEGGTYKLKFEYDSPTGMVIFEIPLVQVHASAEEVANAIQEESHVDAVSFLKEQAWKSEFATYEVAIRDFYTVIHSSGRVEKHPQASATVNSQAEGQTILFAVLGQSVKKGELLAVVKAAGVESNINTKLEQSKISFEKSKSDFARTKPLAKKQVVSQKDFMQIKFRYRQDSLRYHQLAKQVSQGGLKIESPMDGYISNLFVANGQYVDNGSAILSVSNSKKLLIKAYVNQCDFQKVSGIYDANFMLSGSQKTISLSDLNGKVIANHPFVNENLTRIPVVFSAYNEGGLMPGMFLEAYLKTGKKEAAMVIPLSAIIEEQGQYYVFVQASGESFIKRKVEIANRDGLLAEVISGLSLGERIVSKGAYQVKLAAMAGELPLHGHTH